MAWRRKTTTKFEYVQNKELASSVPVSGGPPRLQVNRRTCRFGRYKNPRRPHPPPRVSRVSHYPPQVSGLTLAHPCSPTLTHPRPLPSARPIDSGCAGPFLAPGWWDLGRKVSMSPIETAEVFNAHFAKRYWASSWWCVGGSSSGVQEDGNCAITGRERAGTT